MSEKFYRDSSNKVFGGLISGVVRHLDLSRFTLFCLRVIALIIFLSTPICFLLYIVISVMTPSKEYLDGSCAGCSGEGSCCGEEE